MRYRVFIIPFEISLMRPYNNQLIEKPPCIGKYYTSEYAMNFNKNTNKANPDTIHSLLQSINIKAEGGSLIKFD